MSRWSESSRTLAKGSEESRCKEMSNPFKLINTYSAHPLVGALLGELLGKPRHLVGGLRDGLGNGDQLPLATTVLLSGKIFQSDQDNNW